MTALDRIVAEIQRGEVSFPTHADVAFRVRLALDDPEIHMTAAAQLIQAEPLLAARVVALANSSTFSRSGRSVTDVRSALTRVGLKFARALATAIVMRQMAGSIRQPVFQNLAAKLWEHTVHVAALCHLLASRFGMPGDTAMFAGIVHEVSGFYIIARTAIYPDLFSDGSLLAPEAEIAVSKAVVTALAVPAEVVAAMESLWQPAATKFPPNSLGDILVLAHQLTPIHSPLQRRRDEFPPLPTDPEIEAQLGQILQDSGEELEALTAALHY